MRIAIVDESAARASVIQNGLATLPDCELFVVTGRQGLISFVQLQQSERDLIAQRAELAEDAAGLRARIHELADASLDPDALEEAAHRQIGAARGDEMVFDLAQSQSAKTQ